MWRLLDHGPCPPTWNMAVDVVLRRSHAEAGGPPTLRLYQWSQPTLSVGAGQRLPAALTPASLMALNLTVVRRPTGGRAVLHAGDLTYAIIAGQRDGFPPSVTGVYRRLRRALQTALANLGVATSPGGSARQHGFSCFASAATGDLAWQGKKLVGSAQAWQEQSFLQHGAILLTPQQELWQQILSLLGQETILPVTSLQEILGQLPGLATVKQALRRALEEELGIVLQTGDFTPWERAALAREEGRDADLPQPDGRAARGVA